MQTLFKVVQRWFNVKIFFYNCSVRLFLLTMFKAANRINWSLNFLTFLSVQMDKAAVWLIVADLIRGTILLRINDTWLHMY